MGKPFTIAESKELSDLLKRYANKIWRVAIGKCGGKEEVGEELYSKTLMRIAEREPAWADWWAVKAAGKSFMYFARGVMMRVLSNVMKRAANDPQVHFAGAMTAEIYANTERYNSQEQVAADRDMFEKTRAALAKAGDDLAVKCLDLYAEGVTDYEQMANKLGIDVTRIYKTAEHVKAAALEILEGDET